MVILEFGNNNNVRKYGWKIEIYYKKIEKDGAYQKHFRQKSFVELDTKTITHTEEQKKKLKELG